MKSIFIILFLLQSLASISQNNSESDTLASPVYDTTRIEVRSLHSFYFCGLLFRVLRDCAGKDQSGCCSFEKQILPKEPDMGGQLSCSNGTSLHWMYFDSKEIARQNMESVMAQQKAQVKTFAREKMRLWVAGQETEGYRIRQTGFNGYKSTEIAFAVTVNGHHLFGTLRSIDKNLQTSKELNSVFQQLLRF